MTIPAGGHRHRHPGLPAEEPGYQAAGGRRRGRDLRRRHRPVSRCLDRRRHRAHSWRHGKPRLDQCDGFGRRADFHRPGDRHHRSRLRHPVQRAALERPPDRLGQRPELRLQRLGAEYVGEVDVHKTPDFALSTGAIGATIDIKSPNPFDHPGLQARAFGSGTDYQKDGGVTPAFGALFSDTFADDSIGILAAADYTNKKIEGDHFDIVGWKGATLNSCQMVGGPACTTDANGNYTTPANTKPSWYPQDQAMYLERTDSTAQGRTAGPAVAPRR